MKLRFREREGPRQVCVYCRSQEGALDPCPGCGATFHPACRQELGRCSTIGCDQADAPVPEPPPAIPPWWQRTRRPLAPRPEEDVHRRGILRPRHVNGVGYDPLGYAKVLGGILGLLALVGGFILGGWGHPMGFTLERALLWSLAAVPAALAGAAYGFLQGIVGLCEPQPKGWGLVTWTAIGCSTFAILQYMGAGGLFLVLPVALIFGRYFGFNPSTDT